MKITAKLSKILKDKEITKTGLAKKSGVDYATVHRILAGKHTPSLETLEKIALGLNISLNELISEENQPDIHNIEKFATVPIVGKVCAGKPILSEENVEGYTLLYGEEIKKGTKMFALKVQGDSMTGVGIDDKDLVILKVQPVADNGDIILACLNGGVFLRKFILKEDGTVILQSANTNYEPMVIKDDQRFEIKGVVLWCQKRFK